MCFFSRIICLSFILTLLVACTSSSDKVSDNASADVAGVEDVQQGTASLPASADASLAIHHESSFETLLLDTDGDVNHSARGLFADNPNIIYHYQRVGCTSDTCKQEFVTYAAVQYPVDTILQQWMADILGKFYNHASRQLDVLVNGEKIEYNAEGEPEVLNVGCRPYEGILTDDGKQLFDYYQARLWVIGKGRGDEHGPAGRCGCGIYRCFESSRLASYLVAYSIDDSQFPVHYVCTFDRQTGHKLDVTDIIADEYLADLNDLVADAARERHRRLLRNNRIELAIEQGECDYTSAIDIKEVGFVADGLAVSTGALAFDQWATATHILVLPYARVNNLLKDNYRH